MASRSASRTVIVTISASAGISGSLSAADATLRACASARGADCAFGAEASACFCATSFFFSGGRLCADGRGARRLFAGLKQCRDRLVDLDAFLAFRHQQPRDPSLVDGFELHCRLVSLDFGEDIAGMDF